MEKNTKMQTSLLEDSHVNLGVSHALREEAKMTEISGTKWLGLLKTYGLDGSLAKMCQALLQCQWVSEEVSLTWKVSDTKPSHILFQLQPSMQNIDECDAGLWATPNTMDHLPPRSEEGTIKLMEGQRKGRTKPANLREQVDNKTMDSYSQVSANGLHTPTATANQMSPSMIKRDPGSWGRKMWPTPTTQEIEHPQAELTPNNRRLSKDGNSSHSLNLADSVIMWPTPTTKGYGHASMGQTMIFRKKVEAGEMTEQQAEQMLGCTLRPPRMEKWDDPKKEMFPTPTARDYKCSGNRGS